MPINLDMQDLYNSNENWLLGGADQPRYAGLM